MITITDGASLLTAVTEYLARDNDDTLIARIPTFIQLAEAKFNRNLFTRQMEKRSTALTDATLAEPEFVALPNDFQSMRRIRLTSVIGKPNLEFLTGAAMDDFRWSSGNAAGQPKYFTIFGSEIELVPTPDAPYTIEMIYRANLSSVLVDTGANWLMALAPDLYLYAALMESAPYIKDDNRIQVWAMGFKTALDDLNDLSHTASFNAGPVQIRTSGATP